MDIVKLNEYLNKENGNEDIQALVDIVPLLDGYREHLVEWYTQEPDKEEEAQKIIDAIDIVVEGIEDLDYMSKI